MKANELMQLVPKDKFDKTSVLKLMELTEVEIRPILSELLFWIADINWPIAKDVVCILKKFPRSVVPLIKDKLKPTEKDEEWKYFIISNLIPQLPADAQVLLVDDIARIIDEPTASEEHAEVWNMAVRYRENMRSF